MKTAQSAPPAASVDKDDVGWRHFPEFEKLLSTEEPPQLLSRVENTCRQLDEVMKSGSENDKARAKAAITAFGRSLDLYRGLVEMRDKTLKQK
jgi:hypothetical protein